MALYKIKALGMKKLYFNVLVVVAYYYYTVYN